MKRKESLLVSLVIIILCAAAFGLYQYKSGQASGQQQQPSAAAPATPALPAGTPAAELIVSRDFGREVLQSKQVQIESGETVMDVLKRSIDGLKTGYGGGFVESIGGLGTTYNPGDSSSKKQDWFYYVNGVMADIGAGEFPVHDGDRITWDFHDWDFSVSSPGLIGVYPQPFLQKEPGQERRTPLIIMAAPGFEQSAGKLAERLSALRNEQLAVVPWDEQQFGGESAMILIGDNKAYASSAFYQKLAQEQGMNGLYAVMNDQGIQTLDLQGKTVQAYTDGQVGLLLSTVNPTSRKPLWLIAGIGQSGVDRVIETLVSAAEDANAYPWRNSFGVLVEAGQNAVSLPIIQSKGVTP